MIAATNLSVGYTGEQLVDGLTLSIPERGVLALIGVSGSGKSTLLRTMAGLHAPSSGKLELLGVAPQALFGSGRVQFLHQAPTLWRHLTVWDHVKLGLELVGEPVRTARIQSILEQVGLSEVRNLFPHEMSVGMRARLALARAFAAPPEILLMDEPFASLDPLRREQLNSYVQGLRDDAGCTIVMVTHDIVEAMRFASHFLIFPHKSNRLVVKTNSLRRPISDPNLLSPAALELRDEISTIAQPRLMPAPE